MKVYGSVVWGVGTDVGAGIGRIIGDESDSGFCDAVGEEMNE